VNREVNDRAETISGWKQVRHSSEHHHWGNCRYLALLGM